MRVLFVFTFTFIFHFSFIYDTINARYVRRGSNFPEESETQHRQLRTHRRNSRTPMAEKLKQKQKPSMASEPEKMPQGDLTPITSGANTAPMPMTLDVIAAPTITETQDVSQPKVFLSDETDADEKVRYDQAPKPVAITMSASPVDTSSTAMAQNTADGGLDADEKVVYDRSQSNSVQSSAVFGVSQEPYSGTGQLPISTAPGEVPKVGSEFRPDSRVFIPSRTSSISAPIINKGFQQSSEGGVLTSTSDASVAMPMTLPVLGNEENNARFGITAASATDNQFQQSNRAFLPSGTESISSPANNNGFQQNNNVDGLISSQADGKTALANTNDMQQSSRVLGSSGAEGIEEVQPTSSEGTNGNENADQKSPGAGGRTSMAEKLARKGLPPPPSGNGEETSEQRRERTSMADKLARKGLPAPSAWPEDKNSRTPMAEKLARKGHHGHHHHHKHHRDRSERGSFFQDGQKEAE